MLVQKFVYKKAVKTENILSLHQITEQTQLTKPSKVTQCKYSVTTVTNTIFAHTEMKRRLNAVLWI